MLRTTSYRTPGAPFAGEPEAWDPRMDARRNPAPWHNPYAEERATASDYARRPARPRPAERRPAPRTEYRGVPNAATADDFRDLARSIERLRTHRPAASEPVRPRPQASRAEGWGAPRGAAAAPARPTTAAPRPVRPVRESAPRQPATAREAAPRSAGLGSLAREIASAADKTDVRRLERLLNEVLQKLDALEHAHEPPRRERREAAEREDAPVRRAGERRYGERLAVDDAPPRQRPAEASASRQRTVESRRPSEYTDMDPPPSRGASRGAKPRRLFT